MSLWFWGELKKHEHPGIFMPETGILSFIYETCIFLQHRDFYSWAVLPSPFSSAPSLWSYNLVLIINKLLSFAHLAAPACDALFSPSPHCWDKDERTFVFTLKLQQFFILFHSPRTTETCSCCCVPPDSPPCSLSAQFTTSCLMPLSWALLFAWSKTKTFSWY